MSRYILQRILQIIPTLLVISMILFFMSKCTPSDPVDQLMGITNPAEDLTSMDAYNRKYVELAAKLGLDKPQFYFAIVPRGYPDTLWSLTNAQQKKSFIKLLHNYGNTNYITNYLHRVDRFSRQFSNRLSRAPAREKLQGINLIKGLNGSYNHEMIRASCTALENAFPQLGSDTAFLALQRSFVELEMNQSRFNVLPKFKWFGMDNQYQHWISQLLSTDFGLSIRDGRPVGNKIREALRWTLSINGVAIIVSMLVSILLGVFLAGYASPRMDQFISSLTFVVYAIPLFWLATLMVVFFTTDEYGSWTNLFPGIGVVQIFEGGSFGNRFLASLSRLLLPILCFVLSLMTYLTRQMRSSIKEELAKPYHILLQANGQSKHNRIWRHALPNALFPMITLLGILIPIAVAGSLILEYIFNIPGMGRLLMDSILYQDWNVVFTIVLLIATITMLSLLMADVFYALLDPRVRLKQIKY